MIGRLLVSHALLVPTKASKSKKQVVHEQKFKDPLSSTCQIRSEFLTWNQRSRGSVFTGGTIFLLDFFVFM